MKLQHCAVRTSLICAYAAFVQSAGSAVSPIHAVSANRSVHNDVLLCLQRHLRAEYTLGGPLAAVAGCAPLLRVLHCTAQRPGESVLSVPNAPSSGWLLLKPISACLCHISASTFAAPTMHMEILWCWLAITVVPQRCARFKRNLCSQVLPCMHMDVCFECIQKHEQQQRLRDPTGSVTCPMCRAPIRSTMPLPVQSPDVL